MLAAALQSCGLKVGLYTSPHILSFNERIRINGKPVDNRLIEQSLEQLMPHALAIGTSYFETATAVALDQFAKATVDVEILEAGVGARLDATTAVAADMALITPIGMDHQNWLGDTLHEIASEKAYVMQGCEFTLSAPQLPDVTTTLTAFQPQLQFVQPEQWHDLVTVGEHQKINASLAFAAIKRLDASEKISADLQTARNAITNCSVSGRLEKINIGAARIWLDAAHNRHAIEALLPSLKSLADPFDAILLFTRQDRSLQDCLELLEPYSTALLTSNETESPVDALDQQLSLHPDGNFLILGSFITVAEILRNKLADKQRV